MLSERRKILTMLKEDKISVDEAEELLDALEKAPEQFDEFDRPTVEIVGESPKIVEMFNVMDQIAPTSSAVLVQGETGTGKELVARYIHEKSPRRDSPFVAVHCGSMPENLLEAEIFGYMKGAFTGAYKDKKGKLEMANGGTLFLDEIWEISPSIQVKLLRFLEKGDFERIGGVSIKHADVRLIVATAEDLSEAVKNGKFRSDLYLHISTVPIRTPALRERREDIPLLVEYFLGKFITESNKVIEGVSPEAMQALMEYDWPGNVRELCNIIRRAGTMCKGDSIQPEDLWLRAIEDGKK